MYQYILIRVFGILYLLHFYVNASSPHTSNIPAPSGTRNAKLLLSRLAKISSSAAIIAAASLTSDSKVNAADIGRREYNFRNERIYDTWRHSYIPANPDILRKELGDRRVVVVGEVHSNPLHHKLEFEITRSLAHNVGPAKLAIGLECFYRQHQGALDRYIFEHQNIGTLKKETNWSETWGYDLNMYAKIFQFASMNGVRILGLNVPYAVAKLTAAVGLSNLPAQLRVLLPKVDLNSKKHREQFMSAIYGSPVGHDLTNEASIERMYETQALWDEYMSESVANYLKSNSDTTLIVIAGVGHVLGRVGIPDRITARTNLKPFVIVPQQVEWTSEGLPDVKAPLGPSDCDWCWYTETELQT